MGPAHPCPQARRRAPLVGMRLDLIGDPGVVVSGTASDSHTWNLVYLQLLLEELGRRVHNRRERVGQPRMGIADPAGMRAGLRATRAADATTAGTVTVDSYTRINDHVAARYALDNGADLNGFPIVAHGPAVVSAMLDGV